MNENKKVINVGVIGAGEGASFLLDILSKTKEARIAGLAYRSESRAAVEEARNQGIALYSDFRELADIDEIDILVDVTGNPMVEDFLRQGRKSKAQLLAPLGVLLLWRLIDEHKNSERIMARHLAEQEALYSAGIMPASAANTEQTLNLIIELALSITGMAAGTIALFDEEKGVMKIGASIGFDDAGITEKYEWEVRAGGLTGLILSSNKPTVMENIDNEETVDFGRLRDMGVRSLIAAPLKVSGKIIGILYVDDFKPRKFTERDSKILTLLALQAAAAIDKALLLERAETLAITDGLTKLFNHRHFMRSLEREFSRAQRYKNTIALLMIDVDHFKNYNDTHGHQQGNMVLSKLASILQGSARDTDVVARYGGEEFAVLLTEGDHERAMSVAERMRAEVENALFPGGESQPLGRVTISIGAAAYPDDATTPIGIIECSDKALYYSKNLGRNVVTNYAEMKGKEK